MPSTLEVKCPVCGAQNGHCVGAPVGALYHSERIRAANLKIYEYADCTECRGLKDALLAAEMSLRSCRPDSERHKAKSRWPKAFKDQNYQLELAVNLARANYEIHSVEVHHDKTYESSLGRNLYIRLRDGRLKP
jgi:hypothetical protein